MAEVSNAQTSTAEDKTASISADIQRFADLGLLDTLLLDRSTGGNIIWACKSYESLGAGYGEHDEIRAAAITGENVHVVRTRARKEQIERAMLTKAHAEVFTPMWICKKMIDYADEAWYAEIDDPKNAWRTYITSPRPEITCGEAPYLVNRYDAADGIGLRYDDENMWLTQKLMTQLYGIDVRTVGDHLKKIYADGELAEAATTRKYRIVQTEGLRQVSREVNR